MIRSLFCCFIIIFFTSCSLFKTSIRKSLVPVEMQQIGGGTFMMGDIMNLENEDSLPVHKVELDSFRIGKYEVTFEQYDAFARATGRALPDDAGRGRGKRAVVFVNWYNAKAFCNAYGYRLPTEQEWEYAARSKGKEIVYAGTSDPDSLVNYSRYKKNSAPYSFPVGTKKPNDAGLYDMSGNVFEWIGDWYQFYKTDVDSAQWRDLEKSTFRLIRGGSFKEPENINRTYWRAGTLADIESYDIGFRCVDPG